MKKSSTKGALFTSALALLLCFVMLLGTTFAWFTDEVTSTNNKIQAGTLEIDLLYKDVDENDYVSVKQLIKDGEDTAIFNYTNWEPGYVEAKHVKVDTDGSLALKYTLKIVPIGDVEILADVIDVYYAPSQVALPDRSLDGLTRVGTLREVIEGKNGLVINDQLIPEAAAATLGKTANTTDFATIALKMVESAGNEYQGKKIGTTFDINLFATQFTYEEDSFDNMYDEDAPFGEYVEIDSTADLLATLASAEANQVIAIKLNGDVEWVTDGHHVENDITPASEIIIDGNGYTITATGSGVTPLGDVSAPMTIKNAKIVDNSVSYDEASWEFGYLEIGGRELTCVNVDFADPIQVVSDKATFTNCSFVGHYDKNSTTTTQYGVWLYNGDSTFTNCSFTGTRAMKICDRYAGEVGTVVIDGCTFANISEKPGIAIDDEETLDMNITVKNSTFINCQAGDQSLYVYETDDTVPTLENNTILNNAEYVSTKDELLAFSAKTLTGNNGKAEEACIIIDADIDMQNADFSSIIAQRGDKLTIVGNGHKISNVNVISGVNDNTTGQAGMFYTYPNSTLAVSDLTLENITVTADKESTGYAGAIAGYCEGAVILNNVDVVNATITGVKSSGMLIGHLSGSVVATDCDFSGTVTLADFAEEPNGHYAGKYIGTLAGPATLTDCSVNATVSGNLNAANIGDVYGRATAAGSLTQN